MPAINVVKSDTFEIQRQKINQIGTSLFNITQGGSDLSTDILKLGNGSSNEPSLSYLSDSTLGFYKPFPKTLGIVSNQKSIINFSDSGSNSLTNFVVTKNSVSQNFSVISNTGSGYDAGVYQNVLFTGGSGSTAEATIAVDNFLGNITTIGTGYTPGVYTDIPTKGGSGSGSVVSFTVNGLEGVLTNSGTGYTLGTYPGVSLTNISSSGSTATADILVDSTGVISSVSIINSGSGYSAGDTLSVNSATIGNTGSGFIFTVTENVGELSDLTFTTKGENYSVDDVLTISDVVNLLLTVTQNTDTIIVSGNEFFDIQLNSVVTGVGVDNGTIVSAIDVDTRTITVSKPFILSTSTTITITPIYGNSVTSVEFTISSIGSVSSVLITDSGFGYNTGNILSTNSINLRQIQNYAVTIQETDRLEFTSFPSDLTTADLVELVAGGILSVNFSTDGTLAPAQANQTYTNVSQSSTTGTGTGATFNITRDSSGDISAVQVVIGGRNYQIGDEITIQASSLGGSTVLTLFVDTVTSTISDISIYKIDSPYIFVQSNSIKSGNIIRKVGTSNEYTVLSSVTSNKYFLNDGSGAVMTPNLTFYVGDRYSFSYTESFYESHPFKLSAFRDGIHFPSKIENLTSTLSTSSNQITVGDSTGILIDMQVTVVSGSGSVPTNTRVTNVNGNTITLSTSPTVSGFALLLFSGYSYNTNVQSDSTKTTIFVTSQTPSLYYYCEIHPNMGGDDNREATITINQTNPKPFGTGFVYTLNDILIESIITLNASNGNISSLSNTSQLATFTTGNITTTNSTTTNTNNLNTTELSAISSTLNLNALNFNVKSNLSFIDSSSNSSITISRESGDIEAVGEIKSIFGFNSNGMLSISDNEISSITNDDIIVTPFENRIVKINTDTALVIPSGPTVDRPIGTALQNGAIRFNTDTSQYEGYNSSSLSWSSLGGVRDLDNNTYIVAESSVGANDNVLYFYNDNVNTYRFGGEYQSFYNSKKIRSLNVSAPLYTNWNTNIPVSAGQYLKYRNDVYLVVNGGTTGTSGNEPNNTSGNTFLNGSATLQYNTSAVAPLTFEEISEVRIAPLGGTSLVINGDLKLFNNQVTTITNDILLTPSVNKKVKVNTTTSLVIPVGSDNEKGSPEIGSIRYNTTINQFEGFNSSLNWTSLGGVRDVDGNTYIIPETAPGANENTLYFYNNATNTLRVTQNEIEFDVIDTISSPTSSVLNIDVPLVTLNSLATSIDNSDSTRTFISSTRENFDFGISSGLVNDPVLRISDVGDLYYNTGFGSGILNTIKVFDKDLKSFELSNFRVVTEAVTLVKGITDSGSMIIYNPTVAASAKVQLIAYNLITGNKEFFEYSVIDKVNDVFYTEYGNIKTGSELITAQFSIVQTGVRLTYTLNSSISAGNNVLVKIVSQIIKR